MGDNLPAPLSVSIRDLPEVHVACIEYRPGPGQSDMHSQIGECFQRVKDWAGPGRYDPAAQLTIGAIHLAGGQLESYDCCIQVAGEVQSGSEGVEIKSLPGGRYAVLQILKDPRIIGELIGRFYQAYLPQNDLQIDGSRPTYEIYFGSTMEYCVPILAHL